MWSFLLSVENRLGLFHLLFLPAGNWICVVFFFLKVPPPYVKKMNRKKKYLKNNGASLGRGPENSRKIRSPE